MSDYLQNLEDRGDAYEERIINEIVADLVVSLKDDEENIFQEVIKELHLNNHESSKKIIKAIENVLHNSENDYLQKSNSYQKNRSYNITVDSALSLYIEKLKEKLVGFLPDHEVDKLVISYIGFLQRKEKLLEEGKISDKNTDIDNFMDITKGVVQEERQLDKMRSFLEKIGSSIEKERTYTQNDLIQGLDNSKKDLSPEQREDVQYIKNMLEKEIWESSYQKFILDFFKRTEKLATTSPVEIEDIVEELMKENSISGNIEDDKIDIADYLQRLKSIIYKIS